MFINAEKDLQTHVHNPKITRIKNQNPRIRDLCFQEEVETQYLQCCRQPTNSNKWVTFARTEHKCGSRSRTCEARMDALRSSRKENTIWETVLCKLWQIRVSEVAFTWCIGSWRCHAVWRIQLSNFKNHDRYCKKGNYETALPWKSDHSPLSSNKQLTKARFLATTKRLEKTGKLE